MEPKVIKKGEHTFVDMPHYKKDTILHFNNKDGSEIHYRKIRFGVWKEHYFEDDGDDRHLGCPSYPNCDEAPYGCSVLMGDKVEWIGHRD